MEAEALVSTPHFYAGNPGIYGNHKVGPNGWQGQLWAQKNTEWRSLVDSCECCHLPVSSATASLSLRSTQKNISRPQNGTPRPLLLSPANAVFLALTFGVYEPLGTVYEKFIGSVGQVAGLMLDLSSLPSFLPFTTPPVCQVFEKTPCLRQSRGGARG